MNVKSFISSDGPRGCTRNIAPPFPLVELNLELLKMLEVIETKSVLA
jgi:hypothetical protein